MRMLCAVLAAFTAMLNVGAAVELAPTPVQPVPAAVAPVAEPDSVVLEFTPACVAEVAACTAEGSNSSGRCLAEEIKSDLCKRFEGCTVRVKHVRVSRDCETHATYLIEKPCCDPIRVRVCTIRGCESKTYVAAKSL